jgi:LEA14-like dessication related protein
MRNFVTRACALLFLSTLIGGCSTLATSKLEPPDLSVIGMQMMSTDMFAQRFKVRVLVKNPNDVEIPVRGLEYKIFLMGDSFADGESPDRFVLPAKGEAEFDMLVTTNFVSSLGRLISRVGGGKLEDIEYEIAGTVLLDKGLVRKIPFNHKGTVDIARAVGKSGNI